MMIKCEWGQARRDGIRFSRVAVQPVRFGFTLIELLVVIGIIATLMSMIMPSLSKAKEKGKRIQCISQLRQAMIATNLYTEDYNNWLPPIDYGSLPHVFLFTDYLNQYLETGEIWYCPTGNREPSVNGSPRPDTILHYGVNNYDYDDVDGDGIDNHLAGLGGKNVLRVREPGVAFYLADADPTSSPQDIGGVQSGTTDWPLTSLEETRHSNGYNVGILGGSSQWYNNRPNHREWAIPSR